MHRPKLPSEKVSPRETLPSLHKKERMTQKQKLLELEIRNIHSSRPALPQHEICDSASVEFLRQGDSSHLERIMNN